MPKGSCACGAVQHEYTGEPAAVVVCHCVPCRKFAGTNGSTNAMLKADQYTRPTAGLKQWRRKGDSGKDVTYSDCGESIALNPASLSGPDMLGTVMFVEGDAMPGMVIFKTGTLDDRSVLDSLKPMAEIYTKDRPSCMPAMPDVVQKEAAS